MEGIFKTGRKRFLSLLVIVALLASTLLFFEMESYAATPSIKNFKVTTKTYKTKVCVTVSAQFPPGSRKTGFGWSAPPGYFKGSRSYGSISRATKKSTTITFTKSDYKKAKKDKKGRVCLGVWASCQAGKGYPTKSKNVYLKF